jgi:N-terminal domain of Peptidase_S41 in eukaryotic IRBP
MFFQSCLALILAFVIPSPQHTTPPAEATHPTIPDTPVGRTFRAWLEAFNRGDRGLMEAYFHKYEPSKSLENEMRFRGMTGGFELLRVVRSEPLHFEFLVKERNSDTQAVGTLDVKEGEPAEVTSFDLRAIPPGTSLSDLTFEIDATTRARVIDGAITDLNEFYVFPENAKKMEDAIRARQKNGEYDSVTDGNAFAKMLTDNLQEVSHDKHLRV